MFKKAMLVLVSALLVAQFIPRVRDAEGQAGIIGFNPGTTFGPNATGILYTLGQVMVGGVQIGYNGSALSHVIHVTFPITSTALGNAGATNQVVTATVQLPTTSAYQNNATQTSPTPSVICSYSSFATASAGNAANGEVWNTAWLTDTSSNTQTGRMTLQLNIQNITAATFSSIPGTMACTIFGF